MMATATTTAQEEPGNEEFKVVGWRRLVLIEAGYPDHLAELIARRWNGTDTIDLHRAVELVRQGCDPHTAANILS